jgi:hypothetical protein
MSIKLFVKNLNVSEIEKNVTREYNQINPSLNVNDLISQIANELGINPLKLGKFHCLRD